MRKKYTTTKSIWVKKMPDGEILRCHVVSSTMDDSADLQFRFLGWNPFPCKTMVSTWHIVQEWLSNNGWYPGNAVLSTTITESEGLKIADNPRKLPENPEYLYICTVTGEVGNFVHWHRQYMEDKNRGFLDDSMGFSQWLWGMLYTHTLEIYA